MSTEASKKDTKSQENHQDKKESFDTKIKEKSDKIEVDHVPQEDIQISWYHSFLIRILKTGKMPKSIGIIMDGNRRYATKLKKDKHNRDHIKTLIWF